MRAACGGPGGLPLGSGTHLHSVAIATQPVHRLQIRPIDSAQLGDISYHSPKLHPCLCSVGMRPRTDRHTCSRDHNLHFSWSTTHAKCNHELSVTGRKHQARTSLRYEPTSVTSQFHADFGDILEMSIFNED